MESTYFWDWKPRISFNIRNKQYWKISSGTTQMLAQEGLNCRQQRHVLATAAKSVAWEGQPWPFLASFGQRGASRMPVLGIARLLNK